MRVPTRRRSWSRPILLALGLLAPGVLPSAARAGKVAWLDDVVRQVVRDAEREGKAAGRVAERSAAHSAGRLFVREADEGLEALAKRSDDLARTARRVEQPSEALLEKKFGQLLRHEPEAMKTFGALAPAEKRLVVEMGETAQVLARRHPGRAEELVSKLGVEGMTAVRAYGDDVAEVVAKEGPEAVGVLRKTGRGGWAFFNEKVLPNKKKLAAAGVLALFLADPDKFVDSAGRATQFAVEQFSKAGLRLAGAVGNGASRGLESAIGDALASHGIDSALARKAGMGLAAGVAFLATMVLLGLPIGWAFRPFTWPLRLLARRRRLA